MSEPTTVRRRLTPILVLATILLVVTGSIGTLSAVLSYRNIVRLTDEIRPASESNAAILQDLTDAETGVRAWGISGERSGLDPYVKGLARLPRDQETLRSYAAGDPELEALVARQEQAADAWLQDYATVRVERAGGPGTYDPQLFVVGKNRFDTMRSINAQVAEVLGEEVAQTRRTAVLRARRTAIGLGFLALLGVGVAFFAVRRLLRDIRDPLEHLESVVRRQAAGDRDLRAPLEGPREIRRVAQALNDLADESERSRASEEKVAAEIRALDAARGDFVSNVSHELRTPLTTIAGYVEMVEDEFEGRLSEEHQQMLDATQRNVTRLRMLIEDLLTLSHVENRSTDLQQIDLCELLRDTVDDLRLNASRHGVGLVLRCEGDPVAVLADRGQLQRVFVNLVSNALKFSDGGSNVDVVLERRTDEVDVRVVDRGIGIPAEDLVHVGSRFFRARNAVVGQVPGTGLGLRIVQTIVSNHGGTLQLDSVEDEGTTVTVTLPRQASGLDDQATADSSPG